jgi:hypothetical protein
VLDESIRSNVAALNALGFSAPEIARRLGVAPTTVSYHLRKLASDPSDDPTADPSADDPSAAEGRRPDHPDIAAASSPHDPGGAAAPAGCAETLGVDAAAGLRTRDAVARLLAAGLARAHVARTLRRSSPWTSSWRRGPIAAGITSSCG